MEKLFLHNGYVPRRGKSKARGAGQARRAAETLGGETLYRVQTGAFSKKSNATALADKLKAAGFDTYIVQNDNLYKVQVGAYSVKANADAMAAKLKAAGYDIFITTKSGTAVGADTAPKSPLTKSPARLSAELGATAQTAKTGLQPRAMIIAPCRAA